MYIVGIDIAKRKHEAAVIDGDGAVIIKPFSFTNNCSGYNRLLAMLAKAKLPLDEVSFAMEATGQLTGSLLLPDFRRRASVFQAHQPGADQLHPQLLYPSGQNRSAGRPAHRRGDSFRTLLRVYPASRKHL